MSITEKEKIDIIGIEKDKFVVLTITDHLNWSDPFYHICLLEDKINAYLEFIERGQIDEDYPEYKGKEIVIEIVSMYPFNDEGLEFVKKASAITRTYNVELKQTTYFPRNR